MLDCSAGWEKGGRVKKGGEGGKRDGRERCEEGGKGTGRGKGDEERKRRVRKCWDGREKKG